MSERVVISAVWGRSLRRIAATAPELGRAITYLRNKGDMAIVLVEQYFDFAKELADDFIVMERGAVVMEGDRASMNETDVRNRISV